MKTNIKGKIKRNIKSFTSNFLKVAVAMITVGVIAFYFGNVSQKVFAVDIVTVLGAKNITENSADVRIEYNEGIVTYGEHLSTNSGKSLTVNDCKKAIDPNYIAGTVTLSLFTNLTSGTDYYFKACVIDTNGKLFESNEIALKTLGSANNNNGSPCPDIGPGAENCDPNGTIGGGIKSIKLDNPLKNGNIQSIPDLVKAILEIALKIGVPLIALAIIYAGFKFITAQGNTTKLEEAKQTLIYVVVGAAILLAAYAIATAIVNTVGSVTG